MRQDPVLPNSGVYMLINAQGRPRETYWFFEESENNAYVKKNYFEISYRLINEGKANSVNLRPCTQHALLHFPCFR